MTPGKGGKFACDNSCPNYKSFGLCSHTVAVADVNGMLSAYIEYYKKQKKIPNLSALAKTGMPTGRGRKGTEPPRKRRRGDCIETRVPFNPTLEVDAELPRGSANSYPQNVPSTPAANQLCSCSQGSSFVSAPHGYASCQLVTVGAHPDITRSSMVPSAPPPLHPSAACPETSFGPLLSDHHLLYLAIMLEQFSTCWHLKCHHQEVILRGHLTYTLYVVTYRRVLDV